MTRARRIYSPQEAAVKAGRAGVPLAFDGKPVESIREEWVVQDRWWTERPLHRHYYELALANGRNVTVFRDVQTGSWQRQAA